MIDKSVARTAISAALTNGENVDDPFIAFEGQLSKSHLTKPKKIPRKQLNSSEEENFSDEASIRHEGRDIISSGKKEYKVDLITQVLKKVRVMNVRKTIMAKCSNQENHDYLSLRSKHNIRLYS